jgi:hypothetical protein
MVRLQSQVPSQTFGIQFQPVIRHSIGYIKDMHQPLTANIGMAQTDLGYIYLAPIWPYKFKRLARVQTAPKNGCYFNSFVQKSFIIHSENLSVSKSIAKALQYLFQKTVPVGSRTPRADFSHT